MGPGRGGGGGANLYAFSCVFWEARIFFVFSLFFQVVFWVFLLFLLFFQIVFCFFILFFFFGFFKLGPGRGGGGFLASFPRILTRCMFDGWMT